MNLPVYLDYAATTPIDPRVAEKMLHYLTPTGVFGNPTSLHVFGQAAKKAIDAAREEVADVIYADPAEIIWTSGATESNNLALKGAASLYQQKGKHIVTLKTEHPAVLDCCQQLEKQGFIVTYLAPEKNGLLNLDVFKAALREDTILVSIMQVNNEIGVIQNIQAIAEITAARHILLHVDAAQSVGKVSLNVQKIPVDLVSLCAHKVYGPKGIGALYIRRKPRVRVAAQIQGGGQESGMRSGTLATHQIVGMGAAFALAKQVMEDENQIIAGFKHSFCQALAGFNGVTINGDIEQAVPHILNIHFPGIKADALMQALPELAISAGSACHTKGIEPSYVLRALGMMAFDAHCSVRFSFGRFTTQAEVDYAITRVLRFLK
ncbi:MAG: hypothetical protein ACD_45C00160G0001 [uncultured bacterium]|nr:MAG: hypothetical protein ACD_45C00160G0001 [uncultured bacterium]